MTHFAVFGINYAPEPTGNAPYTTAYAEGLVEAGHRVTVVSGYPHYPSWSSRERRWRWDADEVNGVRLIRVPHAVPEAPSARGRLALESSYGLATVPALARIGGFDAAIGVVPALSGGLAARLAGTLRRVPVGLLVQDLMSAAAAQGGVPGAGRRIVQAVAATERRIVRGAHVAAVAHGFEVPLTEMGARSTTYVPNFSVLPAGRGRSATEVREALGIPCDAFVVGYSGNLGFKQDITTLLTAAARFRTDPNVYFVLIGDGAQRDLVEETVNLGTVRGRFLPLRPAEEVPDTLASFDVLLATQRATEVDMSIPSKLTAYFSAGRPVVAAASRQSETAAQILASGGGVVVPPGDPVALAAAIEDLRADRGSCEQMGCAGALYARDAFDRPRAIQRFVSWAEGVASGMPS